MREVDNEPRIVLTVHEAARLLGVSHVTAYAYVKNGTIPSFRMGRRVLIPRVAFLAKFGGQI